MNLFPIPSSIQFSGRHCDLSDSTWIILPQNAGFSLKSRVMELAGELSRQFVHSVRVCAGVPSCQAVLIRMTRQEGIASQGYHLTIGDQRPIHIAASDDAGFFYAMQTACQLLRNPEQTPCCTIDDKPSLLERGYMLDVSRNKIPTMDTLKELVKSLSRLRYNSLQLYIEHAFSFAGHERVWATYTPLSPEEIMELDAFCQGYFIELVPNINSFGHLERWLCHSQYKNLAESDPPYIYPEDNQPMQAMLTPCQASLDFMDKLYEEYLPNFTSRKVNIGCDETVELGKGKSKELCAKKSTERVYLDFLKQLAALASKRGFSVECWGDIILKKPELIRELPIGITALEWGYEADAPFERDTEHFKESGVRFLVCPGTSSWNSILGRTTNMLENITKAMFYGNKNGAAGFLMTDWGDMGHHQYYPISWPGLAMGGGTAWNAQSTETAEILPYGISLAFAPGDEGIRLGKFLLEMGKINDDFTTQIRNSTPFGRILTMYTWQYKSLGTFLEKMTIEEIRKPIAHTQKLLDELVRAPFQGFNLENQELENGLKMALVAMEFLSRALGGEWNQDEWKDQVLHVISTHEQLWLMRNRSGGLYESSRHLRRFMENDPDAWRNQ